MIAVNRPSEPDALRAKRDAELPEARRRFEAGTLETRKLTGYQVARDALYVAQYGKCAYCEWKPLGKEWSPVEHYRPKTRYWWLTWTWENLLFACPWCNTKHKGSKFPLRDAATALEPEQAPPGDEDPMIIDPAGGVDPTDHIEFVHIAGKWQPIPRNGSERGDQSIRTLGLDQPPLIDKYQDFYAAQLKSLVANMRLAVDQNDAESVRRCWSQLVATVSRTREFAAFSRDVIAREFDDASRREWDLNIPAL